MIDIQEVTADDWPQWRALRLAALADAPFAFTSRLADWQGDGDREERWRGRLSIPGCHLVAALDGVPTGMASGVPAQGTGVEAGVVELISVWVAATARGRGVGDRLIQAVERWAVGTRAELLRLAVAPDNAPAVTLYRRHGFEDTRERGEKWPDERREQIMAKRLPRS